jgi:hypothetical protein
MDPGSTDLLHKLEHITQRIPFGQLEDVIPQ